jgi:molybdopterin molybdotransferase
LSSPKFNLTPLEELFSTLKKELRSIAEESRIGISNCANKVLSRQIYAKYDNPPFDNSAVDGFAINEGRDTKKTGYSLVPGLVKPGFMPEITLKENQSVEILTGAPVPYGTTRIIFKENAEKINKKVYFVKTNDKEKNIRFRGEDFKLGDLLFEKGDQIKTTDLASLIASGNSILSIVRPLKVGLITTGNELKPSTLRPMNGLIFDTNFIPLEILLKYWGHSVIKIGSIVDDLNIMREKIYERLDNVDVIVTTGGVSTGKEDFVSKFLNSEGHVLNWRVAIKPGRPFICGRLGTKYVFGLPGNPVAAFICALVILRPSLGKIGGENTWFKPLSFKTKANFKKFKRAGRTEFLRAKFNQKDGLASIYPYEGSGRLSSMSWSNGLIKLSEPEQSIKVGDLVNFIPYQSFF